MSFTRLLDDYHKAAKGTARKRLERAIWSGFGVDRAVFVMDRSGFSLVTRERGIVP